MADLKTGGLPVSFFASLQDKNITNEQFWNGSNSDRARQFGDWQKTKQYSPAVKAPSATAQPYKAPTTPSYGGQPSSDYSSVSQQMPTDYLGNYTVPESDYMQIQDGPTVDRAAGMNGDFDLNTQNPDGSFLSNNEILRNDNLKKQGDINDRIISDMDAFDWAGYAGAGMQGLDTAMQMGLYGDKKDRLQLGNDALKQNMTMAQGTYDNRAAQQQNLGSTFSRNS